MYHQYNKHLTENRPERKYNAPESKICTLCIVNKLSRIENMYNQYNHLWP